MVVGVSEGHLSHDRKDTDLPWALRGEVAVVKVTLVTVIWTPASVFLKRHL